MTQQNEKRARLHDNEDPEGYRKQNPKKRCISPKAAAKRLAKYQLDFHIATDIEKNRKVTPNGGPHVRDIITAARRLDRYVKAICGFYGPKQKAPPSDLISLAKYELTRFRCLINHYERAMKSVFSIANELRLRESEIQNARVEGF